MGVWLDRIGVTLADATLAGMAITGLVVLAMLQCRQPARRRVWERAALLSTLALPPLAALNPVPRIDVRTSVESFLTLSENEATQARPAESRNRVDHFDRPANDGCLDPGAAALSPFRHLGRAAVVAYLAGVLIGLSGIVIGMFGVLILVRRASPVSALSQSLYESLPCARGSARPRLMTSEHTSRPVVVGSFRPVILVPPSLDEPVAIDRLRLSLLHELAHFENLDHRFSLVASVAEAVWFFLPTFWWIRDQMKLDQEFLADRRAASHFGTSGNYASSLIDLASLHSITGAQCSRAAMVPPSISFPAVASALVQRVQMLLKCPFPIERETPLWWRWSSVCTLLLATVASSGLTLRGFSEWWIQSSASVADERTPFRLAQLVITPGEHHDRRFEFRYQMPDEFTLSLEIMAEPSELRRLEILEHPLAPPDHSDTEHAVYRLWHRVQIRRIEGFDFVEVDSQPVHPRALKRSPSEWLTLRPIPSKTLRIRDLRID